MTETEAKNLRQEVWSALKVPATIPVKRVKIEKRRLTGSTIIVESLSFRAGKYLGRPKNIFAYYAYPEAAQTKRHPTVLVVHGGQCVAWSDAVCALVDRGYAALMLDLPGKGSLREVSRSTGPSMNDAQIHDTEPSRNFLFHAVDAARHALALVRTLPQADAKRIGVMGDSWGSVISSMLVSMNPKVAALVLVNGCGFILEPSISTGRLGQSLARSLTPAELKKWEALYDPRNYYPSLKCPVLLGYARGDTHFTQQQFEASYREISSPIKEKIACAGSHELDWPTREKIYDWLEKHVIQKR